MDASKDVYEKVVLINEEKDSPSARENQISQDSSERDQVSSELIRAISDQQPEAVKSLLERKNRFSRTTDKGQTYLHLCIAIGGIKAWEMAYMLINSGIPINAVQL